MGAMGNLITVEKRKYPACVALWLRRKNPRLLRVRNNILRPGTNVRFGSKADITAYLRNVRFTPKSGHWNSAMRCPLCAKSGHSAPQQMYLIDHIVGQL